MLVKRIMRRLGQKDVVNPDGSDPIPLRALHRHHDDYLSACYKAAAPCASGLGHQFVLVTTATHRDRASNLRGDKVVKIGLVVKGTRSNDYDTRAAAKARPIAESLHGYSEIGGGVCSSHSAIGQHSDSDALDFGWHGGSHQIDSRYYMGIRKVVKVKMVLGTENGCLGLRALL
jgi:hypothetical protein